MDDCMREMGVGDLTVPKRVKRAAAVFYDRAGEDRDALGVPAAHGQTADPLTAVVARTLLNSETPDTFSTAQAAYIRASHDALARPAMMTLPPAGSHTPLILPQPERVL
jgi:cytochrome b pre-mRNA-processing protein 3